MASSLPPPPPDPASLAPSYTTVDARSSSALAPSYVTVDAISTAADVVLESDLARDDSTAISLASTLLPAYLSESQLREQNARDMEERFWDGGHFAEVSPTEAQNRVLQLQRELRATGGSAPRHSKGLFQKACSTDLLFLIDTTGSMAKYIGAAKEQVRSIVKSIETAFLNQAEVRMAVVGYKDHGDINKIQFLDFTPNATKVRQFLSTLTATGGGDVPEDVLGGIQTALSASWKLQTRCIVHIADAPPHGNILHDIGGGDSWSKPGSEPHKLTYEPLLREMTSININYALLRINSLTDRMALKFLEKYRESGAECLLHKNNKYYNQAMVIDVLDRNARQRYKSPKRSAMSGLIFEEAELGIAYSALEHLVLKVVSTSASRTAVRLSTSSSRTAKGAADKKLDPNLAAIAEDEDEEDMEDMIEDVPPKWDTPGWLDDTLMMEGFSPDIGGYAARTLNDMMASDENVKMSLTQLTIHKRSKPFAEGATRTAAYARTAASTNRFVVKSFKKSGKQLTHVAEDMLAQALCKAFALEFNAISGEDQPIDFIVTTCLKGNGKGKGKSTAPSQGECLSLEPYIEGTYVKYNNNCGFVNKDSTDRINQIAQAFSHFTFERSKGRFLVSDLQGVGNLFTDPAIHTVDPKRFHLSDTNLGTEGFKFFFATHECNHICKTLRLKSTRSMVLTGRYKFRDNWPKMDNTVCCSNKLCGKIVRLASARKSDLYPGFHWCDNCWLQLELTVTRSICVAPGEFHEFNVSEFFFESQGRAPPRECVLHRPLPESHERDLTESSVAMTLIGCGLWTRLRSAMKRKSVPAEEKRKTKKDRSKTNVVSSPPEREMTEMTEKQS